MMPEGPLRIPPLPHLQHWRWPIPGSKSLTNRALPLAALSEGCSILEGVLHSDDTQAMIRCLRQLGIGITEDGASHLVVDGGLSRLHPAADPLFVGNSGTTVRFLAALAALVPGSTTLIGDHDMAKRPIADLVDGLRQVGVTVDCATGCPPLTIHGRGALSGSLRIPGTRSSQYISGLLIAGAGTSAGIEVHIDGDLVSEPYVRMTLATIAAFGGSSTVGDQGYRATGPLRAATYTIEPDASAASYAFAAAVAGQGSITVPNLGIDSLQGDIAFVDILERMGATVERKNSAITVSAGRTLRGITVDMHHISDTVMTLAAIAPLATGPTTITNVANIRIKETDRLLATVTELRRLGQGVEHGEDWLRITPAPITPACVECYRDHRMAMSFAVLGLARSGISIADPACVAKTYPDFWLHLAQLYAAHNQECPWATCV